MPICFAINLFRALLLLCITTSTSIAATPHVCLIGGGITSATIAHFLTKKPLQPPPRITVFERSAKLGGRIATVSVPTKHATVDLEAGASIIAGDNRLMSYFTAFLNLSRKPPAARTLGLWDGSAFALRTRRAAPLRSRLAFARRYGTSLLRMKAFVADLLARYAQVYPAAGVDAQWRPCADVEELFARSTGLFNLTQVGFAGVVAAEFNEKFAREMVAAVTRVNYGQDPAQMNGFSGAVALAGSGSGLWAVQGGNVQVVTGLIELAGVEVLLDTAVSRVEVKEDGEKRTYAVHGEREEWACDAVVLATPFELAEISLPEEMVKRLEIGRTFHRTHTTFVRGFLNKVTFGEDPPDSVLTIENVSEPFTSVGMVWSGEDAAEPPIFKVFSAEALDEKAMGRLFGDGAETVANFPWLAYPNFAPPETFPSFDVDMDDGVFIYTSPVESAGSAMEMSAVAGANAAALIQKKLGLTATGPKESSIKEEL